MPEAVDDASKSHAGSIGYAVHRDTFRPKLGRLSVQNQAAEASLREVQRTHAKKHPTPGGARKERKEKSPKLGACAIPIWEARRGARVILPSCLSGTRIGDGRRRRGGRMWAFSCSIDN